MKIIIAGAGEVGFHLSKLLSFESQEITLIDNNRKSLAYANDHLDIKVIKGDATSIRILKEAQIGSTNLFIAVTSTETTNITACVLAKQLGAGRTIARISNSEFIEQKDAVGFSKFGIDELISPESLAAEEIKLLLNQYGFNDTYLFEKGKLKMLSLRLSRTASFVGKSVAEAAEVYPELHFVPMAIQRLATHNTIIPRGNTIFKEGDTVVFMTSQGGDAELFEMSGRTREKIKNVMILGGSKIGRKAAKDLSDNNFRVKLVESNKEVAYDIADELPNVLIINGDGRNVELLEEENISVMDAFIAVTGNSEVNIMSSLVAKARGVRKTIALVENMDYFDLSPTIGIDTLLNKKLLAANNIFRYVRQGEVIALTKLPNLDAELLEFKVLKSSKITKSEIKDLDFPRSAVIGGVIRNGIGIIPMGDFKIQEGDKVVVGCLPRSLEDVEKLFK